MTEPVDRVAVLRRLSSLKYAQLRKAAKRHHINANRRKAVLIAELLKVWGDPDQYDKENISPVKVIPAQVQPRFSPPNSPQNDTLNLTFTVDPEDDNTNNADEENSRGIIRSGREKCVLDVGEQVDSGAPGNVDIVDPNMNNKNSGKLPRHGKSIANLFSRSCNVHYLV
ncbi:unnamed protein product [Gongylonema pulchrum]|uniref:Rho_N domain-containing protein n=1 Tax=Gongylonema pulchrum TaxID=637853 RepID=A0A183EC57_9BILA|nr:unnamed protein product [Gongylonema pulchrum]